MLRLTRTIATAAAAIALTASAAVPAMAVQRTAHKASPPEFYLSLGDSLAMGDQPNAQGVTLPTNQGYADQLYAMIKPKDTDLQLVKLGCPGETTQTLNKGGICGYKGAHRFSLTGKTGSQLAAALLFLRYHPGGVPLITIDIGANDLNGCIALGDPTKIAQCLPPVFVALQKNLTFTLAKLRAAAPHATIVGMYYYDPELVAWLEGTAAGQQFAQLSVVLAGTFNMTFLAAAYKTIKAPVADVFDAFSTTDMKDIVNLPPFGKLPKDVARVCEWTWECTKFQNEHGNAAGYKVMAQTFLATLSKIKSPF